MKIPFFKEVYLLAHWFHILLLFISCGIAISVCGDVWSAIILCMLLIFSFTFEYKWITPSGIYSRWFLNGIRFENAEVTYSKSSEQKDPTLVDIDISSGDKRMCITYMNILPLSVRRKVLQILENACTMHEKQAAPTQSAGRMGKYLKTFLLLLVAMMLVRVISSAVHSQSKSPVMITHKFLGQIDKSIDSEDLKHKWNNALLAREMASDLYREGGNCHISNQQSEANQYYRLSIVWLSRSADLGDPCAMVNLLLIDKRTPLDKLLSDKKRKQFAEHAYTDLSARQNLQPEEQICLMRCYQYGIGTDTDERKAIAIFGALMSMGVDVSW